MLTLTELFELDSDVFSQFSNDNELEELIKPLMIKYPDYYYLRGEDARNLSSSEKDELIKILKSEFN